MSFEMDYQTALTVTVVSIREVTLAVRKRTEKGVKPSVRFSYLGISTSLDFPHRVKPKPVSVLCHRNHVKKVKTSLEIIFQKYDFDSYACAYLHRSKHVYLEFHGAYSQNDSV